MERPAPPLRADAQHLGVAELLWSHWLLSEDSHVTNPQEELGATADRMGKCIPEMQAGIFFFFFFLGLRLRHMEVPSLGFKSELQLPAYTTATGTQDPSCVCDLHRSSWQHRILNPLSKARAQTCILMDSSQVHYC